jgi:predicted 3-demethylubiquinone-9 3-methyltransferase (glyoxalase superfamily)
MQQMSAQKGRRLMAQKITTMLWFDGQAEAAAKFYVSVFKGRQARQADVRTRRQESAGDAVRDPGPGIQRAERRAAFKFNESVSFVVHCKDQKEVDYYWEKLLSGGGEESMCGWLKDKYGLSWQVTPDVLLELMRGPKAPR